MFTVDVDTPCCNDCFGVVKKVILDLLTKAFVQCLNMKTSVLDSVYNSTKYLV